jgi:WD40 repeat protein
VFASAGADGLVKLWDSETLQVSGTLAGQEPLAFSADGRRFAAALKDGTIQVWDSATRKEVSRLHGHAGVLSSLAWSPDGRRLVSASRPQERYSPGPGAGTLQVKLWDTATGQEVLTLPGHGPAAWSADGRRLEYFPTEASLRFRVGASTKDQ